jgi:hypothetical protein
LLLFIIFILLITPYISNSLPPQMTKTNTTQFTSAPAPVYQLRHVDGKPYIPEPPFSVEKAKVWQSQVIIPFNLGQLGNPAAFLGPLPSRAPAPANVHNMHVHFPTSHQSRPLVSFMDPISLSFIRKDFRFRATSPINCPKFCAWMDRLEPTKKKQWEELGIYPLLQMSRTGIPYSHSMLVAAIFFWEGTTNTFHTGRGMMTPTLLDLAAITDVKLGGELYNHRDVTYIPVRFNVGTSGLPSYNAFAEHHHKNTDEISDEEHVAFLAYWLARHIFCNRSVQVTKAHATLASHLHNGTLVSISDLILASLYSSLTDIVGQIKAHVIDPKKNVLFHGPLWLLQLWLVATFPAEVKPFKNRKVACTLDRPAGTSGRDYSVWERLLSSIPIENKVRPQFLEVMFNAMLKKGDFDSSLAPFSDKSKVSPIIAGNFYPRDARYPQRAINFWTQVLTPLFLSYALNGDKPSLVAYQPNLVARQFGLCQTLPKSIFESPGLLNGVFANSPWGVIKTDYDDVCAKAPTIHLYEFKPQYLCTKEFDTWWQTYFNSFVGDSKSKLAQLTAASAALQGKSIRRRRTNSKQIQGMPHGTGF